VNVKFSHIPGPTEACITKAMTAVVKAKPAKSTALREVVRAVLSTCRGTSHPPG
jgi:hypothetical protein